jgi:gliding motility-associated-like protein
MILDAGTWTGTSYTWHNNSNSPQFVIDGNTAGLFTCYVQANYQGCFDSDTISVLYRQSPEVTVEKSNDLNCVIATSSLKASGADSYVWFPTTGLNQPYKPFTKAEPPVTTQYIVIGRNSENCYDSALVTVNVNFSDNSLSYPVPSAFSPNGDGLNDCFGVAYWGRVTNFKLKVFDRFGRVMFYTENPLECWDGFFQGRKQDLGNYVYVVSGIGSCGNINKSGNLLLLK